MERREVRHEFLGQAVHRAASPVKSPRIDLIGLVAMVSLVFLAATTAIAEPSVAIGSQGDSPPAAMDFAAIGVEGSEEVAFSDPEVEAVPVYRRETSQPILEALLTLRSSPSRRPIRKTTDEYLAAAVALGTNADLEPKNPFRKRSRDLFRTERPVSIGNADMLLRLRLRAKARRAMSVELRF
jgi:hypothetical protein